MKNLLNIVWRLTKVLYVILLLVGLLVIWFIWVNNYPYSYSAYLYNVVCNNGTTFDPTSKPISYDTKSGYHYGGYYGEFTVKSDSNDEIIKFDDDEIKAECKYGTASSAWKVKNTPKNYKLISAYTTHVIRTQQDQIKYAIAAFASYYLILEILRRTILYIFFGKNFLTLEKHGQ